MIRTIRERSVLLLSVICFLVPALARAGIGTATVNGVRVIATSDWTAGALKGYQPVRLELVNDSSSPRTVRVYLESSYGNGDLVSQRFTLDGAARVTAEMIVPTFALPNLNRWAREYSLRAESGSDTQHISGVCGSEAPGEKRLMVFTRDRIPAGWRESWEATVMEVSGSEGEDDARSDVRSRLLSLPESASGLALGTSLFEHMPSRHEAYSSLDCVVIDLSKGAPPARKLEPLLAYMRLGGNVAFLGEGAVLKAVAHESLVPLLEERFALNTSFIEATGVELRSCGLGKLLFADTESDLFTQESIRGAIRSILFDQRTLIPSAGERGFSTLEIPGVGELPYKMFVGLLIFFAVIIGPINFILVKRSGKPALLLLTIPVISIIASVLLIGYGVLYQGLDTKSASVSLAFLDQRSELLDVIEDRHCFVGLATSGGLQPAAGTSCIPVSVSDPEARFVINVGESTVLSSGFFMSRQDMHQRFFSERTSRLRLVVEKSGDGLRVTNGFTCGLTELSLRDAEGRGWRLAGDLDAGESGLLERVAEGAQALEERSEIAILIRRARMTREFELYPGSYAAVLEENIFQDDCGLDMNELAGEHGLLGILDLGDFR